jgi:hypothetical protein
MRSKTKRRELARRKTKLGLPDLITPSQPSPSLPSSNLPSKNSAPNHFANSNSFVIACHTRWRGTFKRIWSVYKDQMCLPYTMKPERSATLS